MTETPKTFDDWLLRRLNTWQGSNDPYSMEAAFEGGRAAGRLEGLEEAAKISDDASQPDWRAEHTGAYVQGCEDACGFISDTIRALAKEKTDEI